MTVDPYGEERRASLEAYQPKRPTVRASDGDRERAVQLLQQHLTEGRLDYEEFSERVDEAYAARTMADIATALRELPHIPLAETTPATGGTTTPATSTDAQVTKAALIANIGTYVFVNSMLVGIWLLSSIDEGELEFFWPIFPVFFWGLGVLAQIVQAIRQR